MGLNKSYCAHAQFTKFLAALFVALGVMVTIMLAVQVVVAKAVA
jgi:hypothetical protein